MSLAQAGSRSGVAVNHAANLKVAKYSSPCRRIAHVFHPAALDTLGTWSEAFDTLVTQLCSFGHRQLSLPLGPLTAYWRRTLCFGLSRAVARSIQRSADLLLNPGGVLAPASRSHQVEHLLLDRWYSFAA